MTALNVCPYCGGLIASRVDLCDRCSAAIRASGGQIVPNLAHLIERSGPMIEGFKEIFQAAIGRSLLDPRKKQALQDAYGDIRPSFEALSNVLLQASGFLKTSPDLAGPDRRAGEHVARRLMVTQLELVNAMERNKDRIASCFR